MGWWDDVRATPPPHPCGRTESCTLRILTDAFTGAHGKGRRGDKGDLLWGLLPCRRLGEYPSPSCFKGESAGWAQGGAYTLPRGVGGEREKVRRRDGSVHAPARCGAAQAPHHHFYLFPFLSFPHAILKRRGLEDGEDNVGLGTIVSREIFPYGCD